MFWICVPLAASVILPAAWGYLGDEVSALCCVSRRTRSLDLADRRLSRLRLALTASGAPQRVPQERRGRVNWALAREHPHTMGYCLIMACTALGNAAIDTLLFDWHGLQFCYALGAAAGLSILAFRWLPRQVRIVADRFSTVTWGQCS